MSVYKNLKKKVFGFFEKPKSMIAKAVHVFIIGLILLTAVSLIVEHGYTDFFKKYELYFNYLDTFILAVFTVEYVLRFWAAPRRVKFFFNFFSLIDFFAVAPMYFGFTNIAAIRSLRLLRVLRLTRIFRVFRIFRYTKFVKTLFSLKDTILEKILPVITVFTVLKLCIFFLETKGWWIQSYNLETTFLVIGFVLGIILSQKISVAYTKFILLEDSVTKIHGFAVSINTVLKAHHKNEKACKAVQSWVDTFHGILLRKKPKHAFYKINEKLYGEIHKLIQASPAYAELIRIYSRLNEEASYMLNRMDALTPRAYDQILHRATLIYSLLLVVFMPGVLGIISTLIATYVLYGMYQVTDDMDNAMTHLEDALINADINDLEVLKKKL